MFPEMKQRLPPRLRPTLLEPSATMRKRFGIFTETRRWSRRWLFIAVLGCLLFFQLMYSYSIRQTDGSTTDWYQARWSVREQAKQAARISNETSCRALAGKFEEPYSDLYMGQPLDMDGPMYALYRWDSTITKAQLRWQRNLTENRQMPDNTRIFFKVKDSLLFRS